MVKPQGVVRERIDGLKPDWDEDPNQSMESESSLSSVQLSHIEGYKALLETQMELVTSILDNLFGPEKKEAPPRVHRSRLLTETSLAASI